MTDIATDETRDLISSDKVEGTTVYNRAGEKLGSISEVMIGKRDGQVQYAVLSFGGLFGLGSDHYPLPWSMLDYEPEQGGYVVDIDKERLNDAPRYTREDPPAYDRAYRENIYAYYGLPFAW